ncbi:hypothetical protein A1342_07690 [Methylomonas methanica]|uniref:Uncharacterized protein n=1 Tax=Methylomonas denitrificans TaxID=1538553 RepID=A0A140E6R9_9GAMM|nr:hypothetical protein JT25_021855 [Methylomonas denitrificans]OAH99598.1 hypothetical protein A1342_07690 [Methylomonas methanica]
MFWNNQYEIDQCLKCIGEISELIAWFVDWKILGTGESRKNAPNRPLSGRSAKCRFCKLQYYKADVGGLNQSANSVEKVGIFGEAGNDVLNGH